jgi:predicted acetyltransferase
MRQFGFVLILMVMLAAASVRLGWVLGYDKRTEELTEEIVEDFRKKFVKRFEEEFERRVNAAIEEETRRVHDELIELLEEERKKNEGSSSN